MPLYLNRQSELQTRVGICTFARVAQGLQQVASSFYAKKLKARKCLLRGRCYATEICWAITIVEANNSHSNTEAS